jgi:hypothetical protein
MDQTHKIEQAYYKALGIETTYRDYPEIEYDCLVDIDGNAVPGILFSSTLGFVIMQREEINVEFFSYGVMAGHPEGTSPTSVYYGEEQWKSGLWVLNAAIVIAATDKLERAKLVL